MKSVLTILALLTSFNAFAAGDISGSEAIKTLRYTFTAFEKDGATGETPKHKTCVIAAYQMSDDSYYVSIEGEHGESYASFHVEPKDKLSSFDKGTGGYEVAGMKNLKTGAFLKYVTYEDMSNIDVTIKEEEDGKSVTCSYVE